MSKLLQEAKDVNTPHRNIIKKPSETTLSRIKRLYLV